MSRSVHPLESESEEARAEPPGVAAVNRALGILLAFDKQTPELSLVDLAARTGLHKSTILRLAESLEHFAFLQRTPAGKYKVGPQPVRLAALYRSDLHPAEVVMPVLRQLTADTSESAALYVVAGDRRLCAYRCRSPRGVTDNVQQGELLPLARGAGGHVLMAFTGERGDRYDEIRRDKIAVTLGDRDKETAAVACPVFGPDERLEGALSISGPISRFTPHAVRFFSAHLIEASVKLSLLLGGDPHPLSNAMHAMRDHD